MNNTQYENSVLQVPIEDIIPNRFQPRLAFDDASLQDLATSIKQHGIIQPLVLRRKADKYEIVAGERRYKAARMAGLISVPAIISDMDDNTSAEVAVVENVQRKNLTAIEEAKSYQMLLDKGYMTQEELAKKMGLSQSAIANKLRLLTLDEAVQDAILQEKISERHARSLLKITDKTKQKQLLNRIITERLTVKQLEEEIKKMNVTEPETEIDDIPIINNAPNIANIVNNSVDINPQNNVANNFDFSSTSNNNEPTAEKPSTFFESPEKMPNKFFNFLEDEAANMSFEEMMPSFDLSSKTTETGAISEPNLASDLLSQTDNIEMLDDFFIPKSADEKPATNNEYLNQVIRTIRGLNLDSDKVTIEEMNLPTEYQITIKIKKDNI